MPAPAAVTTLIDRFQRNLPAYTRGQYNETQARVEFIDPLFIALGWDVRNARSKHEETLHMNTAQRLAAWHAAVAHRDLTQIPAFLAEEIVFRSPVYWKPMHGRQTVALVLGTVIQLFEDFEYHREWTLHDEAGEQWALEFSAHIGTENGDVQLKGLDLMRWNADGQIVEFEVMIRPLNALTVVGAEMGKRLAPYLAPGKRTAP